MDVELKAKWVAALRSGEYRQGAGRLKSSNGCFCCLGVLCDIIDPTWQEPHFINEGAKPEVYSMTHKSGSTMHIDDDLWASLNFVGDCQIDLAGMNDGQGKTFPEIADWIEANL